MILKSIKQLVKRWADGLRDALGKRVEGGGYVPSHLGFAPRAVTVQPREHVVRLSYRKKKSQQQNWQKWKGKG